MALEKSCLVCRCCSKNETDFRETFKFDGSNGSEVLNKQLWNIFISRRLLGLPRTLCEGILKLSNGRKNPSSWFVICGECGEMLEEACKLHREILELESRLKMLGNRLKRNIMEIQERRRNLGERDEKSSVEKRILRWLGNEVDLVSTPAVVKSERLSPARSHLGDSDNDNWSSFDSLTNVRSEDTEESIILDKQLKEGQSEYRETGCGVNCFTKPKRKRGRPPGSRNKNNLDGRTLEKRLSPVTSVKDKCTEDLSGERRAKERKVACSRCPAIYRNNAELAAHLRLHKKCDDKLSNLFDCKICGYPCLSERTMKQHVSAKHELPKYACDVCGYEAIGKNCLEKHKAQHVEAEYVTVTGQQCNMCQKKFNSHTDLTTHQRLDHAREFNDKLYRCDKCPNAYYTTNKTLHDHISLVHDSVSSTQKVEDQASIVIKEEFSSPENENADNESCEEGIRLERDFSSYSADLDDNEACDEKVNQEYTKKLRSPAFKTKLKNSGDVCSSDEISFSEVEDDVWKPTTTKSVSISRSKNSIRKAKSSLRSKRGIGKNKCSKKYKANCSRCPAAFRNDGELAYHIGLHERCDQAGNQFDCKTCGYPCESERTLRQHASLKHEPQKYICDVCGYEAPGKKRLQRHKKIHNNQVDGKTYQCDICKDKPQFHNYVSFTRHQRLEHAEELNILLFKCEKCPGVYTSNKMLQDHILHVHEGNSKYCCDICGKGFVSQNNLKEHMETHEERERSEICWVCGVDFLNKKTLQGHIRKFHPKEHNTKYAQLKEKKEDPEKEFKCLYCEFTSPFRVVVMRHRKTHREVYRHLCEICSNEYSTLANLAMHKKIAHGGEKSIVQCEWCRKSFAHRHYLQNHIPRCKMRPPDIPLPKPKKQFRDTLLIRSEDETEKKNDSADDTTSSTNVSKSIKIDTISQKETSNHETTEPKGKSSLCKYCKDFSSNNRGKMYDHVMKMHKDKLEFKYYCEICDAKYTMKTSLNRHIAVHHTTANMIACMYCEKIFRHWSLLRLHYKKNCKLFPPGAPIPEQPENTRPPKRRLKKEKKPTEHTTLSEQNSVESVTKTKKPGRKPKSIDKKMLSPLLTKQDDSIRIIDDTDMPSEQQQFHIQQPSTSSSIPSLPFPLAYHTYQQGIGATVGNTADMNNSEMAAAAVHNMLNMYNNSQLGDAGGSTNRPHSTGGGQRGWW